MPSTFQEEASGSHFRKLHTCTVLLAKETRPEPSSLSHSILSHEPSAQKKQREGDRERKQREGKEMEVKISPNYGVPWSKCFERCSCNSVNIVSGRVTPDDWERVCHWLALLWDIVTARYVSEIKSTHRRVFVYLSVHQSTHTLAFLFYLFIPPCLSALSLLSFTVFTSLHQWFKCTSCPLHFSFSLSSLSLLPHSDCLKKHSLSKLTATQAEI